MRAQRRKRKLNFSSIFSRRLNRLGAVDEALAVGESVFSGTKTLLNDISGEARDGEIMAVLGASGSEKSTLIDALANRIAKGRLKGTLALNGEALESSLLKVISAYVMQDDLLFPMLTVEETLTFAAEFRLPSVPPIWRPHTSFTMLRRDYEYECHSPLRLKGLFC